MSLSLQRARTDLFRAAAVVNPQTAPLHLPVDLVAALVMNPNADRVLRDYRTDITAALNQAREAQG